MRLILYTGKGGVGKSSVAAATAVRTAELGRRTLLVSSDMAHNLSDILDVPVGGEAVRIAENLMALEVDALREIREHWSPTQAYMSGLLAYLGMDNAVAEEMALIPGMDELFVLTRLLRELESGDYDVVIVDCSPTASTLRILTLTDTACTKLNKLIDAERKILKLVRPVTNRFKSVRDLIPKDDFYGAFSDIVQRVEQLGVYLKDPEIGSVRLVLNPDRVAIAETRRSFTYFGLFGFPVDGVIVNKVFPADLADGYLQDWFVLQQDLLAAIDRSFLDVSTYRVPLLDHEPIGRQALSEMAAGVFGDRSPDAVLSRSRFVTIARVDGKQRLTFLLPNADRQQLDIGRKGNDLLLKAGAYTRVFSLPDTLVNQEIAGACFADDELTITFDTA